MIVYERDTGRIINKLGTGQDIETRYFHHSKEFKDNLAGLKLEKYPYDLENYKVVSNKLIRMSNQEILELQLYGRILTDDERLLETLKPSTEEIKNAEKTIEILSLLSEVL